MSEALEQSDLREGYKTVKLGPREIPIPDEWDVVPFEEAIELNPKYEKPDNGPFDYLPMDAVDEDKQTIEYWTQREKDDCTTTWFKNGDTVYAKITPCTENGKIAFIEDLDTEVGSGSTEFLVFHPRDGVTDERFVYYLSNLPEFRSVTISLMEGSTGRQRVPSDVFKGGIQVPLPPLPEQRRIADILSTVDEQIQQTDEIIEETGELKRGLMQDLLTTGTGDVVTTKKERIGPMPIEIAESWDMEYFDDVIELNPNDDVPDNEAFPYLPMDSVNEETRTIDYWEQRDAEDCTRVRFRKGDTVYAKITPCTENGKIAFIEGPDGLAFGSTEFLVFRARENQMLPKYVYYLSNLPQFRAVTISLMEGSTGRQRVPSDTFDQNIRVPVPPVEEQRTIVETLDRVQQRSMQERETKQFFKELKRGLMQDLLTGKVRVNTD